VCVHFVRFGQRRGPVQRARSRDWHTSRLASVWTPDICFPRADHGGEFAKLFAGDKWVNVSIEEGRSRTSFARASSKPMMLRMPREIAGSVT
jgi:hypothetical protein